MFLSIEAFSIWKIVQYGQCQKLEPSQSAASISGGDIVTFKHTELFGSLVANVLTILGPVRQRLG